MAALSAAKVSLPAIAASILLGLISAVDAQCNTVTTYSDATSEVPLSSMVRAARNAEDFIGFEGALTISNGTGKVSFFNDRSASTFEPQFCKIEFVGPNEDSIIELGRKRHIELLKQAQYEVSSPPISYDLPV